MDPSCSAMAFAVSPLFLGACLTSSSLLRYVLRVDASLDAVSTPIVPSETILIGALDYVIDMQGTKKVEIPEVMMHYIMKIVLDKENYPLLIHCNHGKVIRTSTQLDR